jgi:hypothetical protein
MDKSISEYQDKSPFSIVSGGELNHLFQGLRGDLSKGVEINSKKEEDKCESIATFKTSEISNNNFKKVKLPYKKVSTNYLKDFEEDLNDLELTEEDFKPLVMNDFKNDFSFNPNLN